MFLEIFIPNAHVLITLLQKQKTVAVTSIHEHVFVVITES